MAESLSVPPLDFSFQTTTELIEPLFAAEEGDQQRFWKLTRKFVDSLAEADPAQKIRIVSHHDSQLGISAQDG